MTRDQIDRLINPPLIEREGMVVLSPLLGSVGDYMKYIKDHREDYKRLFGGS